ncbi:MAG TPA: choice-of-anchor tandem repeat GloVer-containing protein [Rhizomicrobium sp.]|nr:choice-of-anchor tandem repeat GloVer-containing protein [Rhizomicrobium sp.]
MRAISTTLIACALACVMHAPIAEAQTETVLYSFCSQDYCADGAYPHADLLNVKGTLYGTASSGGANYGECNNDDIACGVMFSLNPQTSVETVIHSFGPGDGWEPLDGVIAVNGTLYGTTEDGGRGKWCSCGTVFSLNPTTGAEAVLYSFCGKKFCKDGSGPAADILAIGGSLYGTTGGGGGRHRDGTVFSLDITNDTEIALHSFGDRGSGGFAPRASLINVNGTFYGTTVDGGKHGSGTVFSLDAATGKVRVVYSFCSQSHCADGSAPVASLVNINGVLYGTTGDGGTGNCGNYGCGTVFSLNPVAGIETVLHSFQNDGKDGWWPFSGLTNVDGMLYGTTGDGGIGNCNDNYADGCGTVFSVNPRTGTEKVIYSFQNNGTDGTNPVAGVISIRGIIYGTTEYGGSFGAGTVFSIVR